MNMNPGRFFMPRMGSNIGPMMGASLPFRGNNIGLFGRITNSLRSFNWSGLLNGANKTLNVVNQTIPLVRQAGPMLNNMKSILRIAKVFGNETARSSKNTSNNNGVIKKNENITYVDNVSNDVVQKKEVTNNNYPNFFV